MNWLKPFGVIALALLAGAAQAQQWPDKPVRLMVPFPPGTAPDIAARLMADKLSQAWKQQMVVESRPGAGGIPGMSAFIKTAPDGYSFAVVPATVVTLTPNLFKNPQYSIDNDVTPVAILATGPFIIAVNSGIGVNSLDELLKIAKAQPGKINMAPPGLNTTPHLAGELLAMLAGVRFYPVPYNGSVPAVTATITNESQFTIDGVPALASNIRAGKLIAVAVTSRQRIPGFENVPPVADTFKGFEAIGWFAVLAPAKTPVAMIERMNRDVNDVVRIPEIVTRYADLGIYPRPGSVKDAADFLASERKLWAKVIQDLGIQPQ
ncbi:MAG TPA: tripartite tricarboxylate transporter substrate-binding protein [Burkholderiales bacterium]